MHGDRGGARKRQGRKSVPRQTLKVMRNLRLSPGRRRGGMKEFLKQDRAGSRLTPARRVFIGAVNHSDKSQTISTFMDQAKKIKVLVIEDEPKLGRLLRTSLEEQGYATLETATATEGVEAAVKWRPDAVLLDLDVTCGQGMAALQRLRQSSPMPVLVMSM